VGEVVAIVFFVFFPSFHLFFVFLLLGLMLLYIHVSFYNSLLNMYYHHTIDTRNKNKGKTRHEDKKVNKVCGEHFHRQVGQFKTQTTSKLVTPWGKMQTDLLKNLKYKYVRGGESSQSTKTNAPNVIMSK